MSVRSRRRGREEAFKLLFQADQGVLPWDQLLELEVGLTTVPAEPWQFAVELAAGTMARLDELDPLLASLASGWSLERMPAADKAILRLAAYELLHRDDTPVGVAINEAVELAKKYGTEDSSRFINGILGTLAREHCPERVEPGDEA